MPTSDSSSPTGPDVNLTRRVLDAAGAAGIDAVGVADASAMHDTRAVLEERKRLGLHGGMQFTYRNPARSTDPGRTLRGARSMVVGARRYAAPVGVGPSPSPVPSPAPPSDPAARPPARPPAAIVARYAVDDPYTPLRAGLEQVADELRAAGWTARVLADDNALVDRAAAHRAGIGWFGRNTNLLLPGAGSWFVLGAVLTDAWLEPAPTPVADGCGTCRRCLDGCPTGALVAPGVLDARRCLAWLVQADGDFPRVFRRALGRRIYGCDDCQEVCPPNRDPRRAPEAVAGAELDVCWLLEADDDELLEWIGHWYIPRRDLAVVRRNALVVLGNSGAQCAEWGAWTRVDAVLGRHLRGDDLLARHAAWAALELGRRHLLDAADVARRAVVVDELRAHDTDVASGGGTGEDERP